MRWHPIDLDTLQELMAAGLQSADDDLRAFYLQTRRDPVKWVQHPWGDQGGGFWAVAVHQNRVLWFNDIEDGFNVSTFEHAGLIPRDQYWCNQDDLDAALKLLRDGGGMRAGPPRPVTGR